jgi:methylphosphotriester-DNA--protein-cysteine methyltransferase
LRKNVSYYETGEAAEKAGFRPCKRCRPDLLDYAPMLELARQTKELIDGYYSQRKRLAEKMKELNVSANHVASIFKRQYGMPPLQYLNQIRAEHAKKMLLETAMPIIDVAGETGFDSLSAFYGFFKKQTGITPKECRANSNGGGK